jgi:hypothetical protein
MCSARPRPSAADRVDHHVRHAAGGRRRRPLASTDHVEDVVTGEVVERIAGSPRGRRSWDQDGVLQTARMEPLAVHAHDLEVVDVDVEQMVLARVVDERPRLDGAEDRHTTVFLSGLNRSPLISAVKFLPLPNGKTNVRFFKTGRLPSGLLGVASRCGIATTDLTVWPGWNVRKTLSEIPVGFTCSPWQSWLVALSNIHMSRRRKTTKRL